MRGTKGAAWLAVAGLSCCSCGAAQGAFPGQNGKIVVAKRHPWSVYGEPRWVGIPADHERS